MTPFLDFLRSRLEQPLGTEDVLAAFLPLLRQVVQAHDSGRVAPLEGVGLLRVEGARIFFEAAHLAAPRHSPDKLRALEQPAARAFEVVDELHRTTDLDEGIQTEDSVLAGAPGQEPTRPVFLPGFATWEHLVDHHDPLADVAVLGMVLAGLACGLDLTDPEDFKRFVGHRRNLFALRPGLHPVLAKTVVQMTELDRRRRPRTLASILHRLENYRDVDPGLDVDLARIPGFHQKDLKGKREIVLDRLRERLFEVSRRNRLLYFQPTLRQLNLTEGSVPLLIDVRNLRPDHLLTWRPELARSFADGRTLPLGRYLRFEEAPYLSGTLDGILADTRRDLAEYGFSHLRLVLAFLSWHDLKEAPAERIRSPLLLLPVRLAKKKGVRDSYTLEATGPSAEVNPVLRHRLKSLYGIRLPERVDLSERMADEFHAFLEERIRATEPGITLAKVELPQVKLVHERARRRLDRWRRRERLGGRGVRVFHDLSYSYERENFHPLGLRLFLAKVRPSPTKLRTLLEDPTRKRAQFAEPVDEKRRDVLVFGEGGPANPYLWEFDLTNVTLGNFKYRKVSLVRDYDALLEEELPNPAFDSIFSLGPRDPPAPPPEPIPFEVLFPVVSCDPTQASAIAVARTGKSYVIQGPPGTGKSQTITNLIADYVARGKRVLFVCEKRAALDVVYHRLRALGLHETCCLVHDAQEDKKDFIRDLRETYERFLAQGAVGEEAKSGPGGKGAGPEETRRRQVADLRKELEPLERHDEWMRGTPEGVGLPLRKLLHRAVELAENKTALAPLQREALPPYAEWVRGAEALERFRAALAEVRPDGVFARHPLAALDPRVAQAERPSERVFGGVERAEAKRSRAAQAFEATGLPREQWDALDAARALGDFARQALFLARKGLLELLDPAAPLAKRLAETSAELAQRDGDCAGARVAAAGWRAKLPAEEVENALAQARLVEGKLLSVLRPAWWALRRILNERYDFARHAVRPTWTQVLEALRQEYDALAARAAAEARARAAFQLEAEGESPASFGGRVRELRAAFDRLPRAVAEGVRRLRLAPGAAATVEELAGAAADLDELARELDGLVAPAATRTLSGLRGVLDRVRAVGASENEADGGLARFVECLAALGALPPALAEAFRAFHLDPTGLEAAMADRGLEVAALRERALGRFNGAERERRLREVERLHAAWQEGNALVVRERVRRRFLDRVRLSMLPADRLDADQKAFKKRYAAGRKELEHEFEKTMRYRSVRDLLGGASGEALQDLKPVWLMSPLSVSDTLPLDADHFDVVIFDEASQIPLEDAVPAVFRSRQVIVVGDRMQLPPTNFFSTKRTDGEDDDPGPASGPRPASGAGLGGVVAVAEDEDDEPAGCDLEQSSFLAHAANRLPAALLGWHYRSRSEALIAFSNAAFYAGRLLTVPDARLPREDLPAIVVEAPEEGARTWPRLLERSVSFHHLPKAVYAQRRNEGEARYIAQLVRGLLSGAAGKSIGVVAFSEAQQEEIERALGDLAREDAAFASLLEAEYEREVDGQYVGLLVKNLENIQGDERDVVLLSVCYGPGPDGRMLMNFGPINQEGGEKRLNVAFSRARHSMVVVSSIRHDRITNEYNDGARCLRNYLRYAEAMSAGDLRSGRRVLAEARGRQEDGAVVGGADAEPSGIGRTAGGASSGDGAIAGGTSTAGPTLGGDASGGATSGGGDVPGVAGGDAVVVRLAAALRERGWGVDVGVGLSHFRCQLAVRRPGEWEYRLGILVDTSEAYAERDVVSRDVLRPALLRSFGWRVARVLAKDWYHDRAGVLAGLERALEEAKKGASS
ncbi:MAG: DUF4011 domain-containing protein [Planctomycetes bacterium]|nr:DUF4011 domain-containing protein [Planctomycetota bacterium]